MFLNKVKIPSKLSYTFLDVHNKKKKKKGGTEGTTPRADSAF